MVHVEEDTFGECVNPFTNKKETIRRFGLSNCNGLYIQVITYGATITALCFPDKDGECGDVALGFDDIEGYQNAANPYIGGTIGRVCSRVGNGKFTLNGEEVNVSKNFLGKHQLHGGVLGFDKVIWEVEKVTEDGVVMMFRSPDGHEGYPGEVTARMTFSITDDNLFSFCLEAETTKPTPVNMTNHSYFNLAGHDTGKKGMSEHYVTIKAKQITGMDKDTVPDGTIIELEGHPLDLRKLTNVGEGLKKIEPEPGYDHNYVLDWKKEGLTLQAKAYHPYSGRFMEITSNQPCMHFYTSHNMAERGGKGTFVGKCGAKYNKHGSFCMETHWYPNAMNHPNFPNVILNPGEKYKHICIFRLGVCPCFDHDVPSCPAKGPYE